MPLILASISTDGTVAMNSDTVKKEILHLLGFDLQRGDIIRFMNDLSCGTVSSSVSAELPLIVLGYASIYTGGTSAGRIVIEAAMATEPSSRFIEPSAIGREYVRVL